MVQGRLLEPHSHLVCQALGPSEYTNSHLFWLQSAGGLGLEPADEQLACQPAKRFPNGNWPNPTTALAKGNEARSCQRGEARSRQANPCEIAAQPRNLLQQAQIGGGGPFTPQVLGAGA